MHSPIFDGATVLSIEDDAPVRDAIVAYLEDSDFDVLEAENGRLGIEQFRARRPDLVLCDLRMPEADGFEVLAAVKEESPDTPIIVVSGTGDVADAVRALKLGAWDYITKPIHDMTVLELAVRKALERAHLMRENKRYQLELEATNKKLKKSLKLIEEDEEAGRRIQFQLLPEEHTAIGEYEFSRALFTSAYLSGDFLDYFLIDDDHFGFYIADVSGHGVPSAFVTVFLKSLMNQFIEDQRQGKDDVLFEPARLLHRLNEKIQQQKVDRYLTMFYALIDRQRGIISYCNGGQYPFPILYDCNNASHLKQKNFPVGMFDTADYTTVQMALPEDFIVTMFSDGILELLSLDTLREKNHFLLSLFSDMEVSLSDIIRSLDLNAEKDLPDDATILMIKRRCRNGR